MTFPTIIPPSSLALTPEEFERALQVMEADLAWAIEKDRAEETNTRIQTETLPQIRDFIAGHRARAERMK